MILMAFVMNVFLPFFAIYNTPSEQAIGQKELSSLFGEKILICTTDGFKWVTWEELRNQKHRPTPGDHYKCPLCYLAAHGVKDVLPASAPVSPFVFSVAVLSPPFAQPHGLRGRLLLSGSLSRAPPHLA